MSTSALGELAALFLRLGFVAFGGPAAHIAMMEEEVVGRRRWLTRDHFLDLVGATNLIPGPNSTEMAIHVGYIHAGWRGLVVAGLCFILPAALITGGLAWFYVRYGALPEIEPFLFGIKPAVVVIILGAVWRLGRAAVKGWRLLVIGLIVALVALTGINPVIVLFAGGVSGALWLRFGGPGNGVTLALTGLWPWLQAVETGMSKLTALAAPPAAVSLAQLGWFFFTVGAVLFGSGYVLVAFLEGRLVQGYGWLNQQQLLDAIAMGQFTPGPVLTTSTFIGYLIAGVPGAVVATVGIFVPSFFFVALLNPWVPRLRESPWTAAFLDAVNVSAVGLMAAVTLRLARTTLDVWQGWVVLLVVLLISVLGKVKGPWLIVIGAAVGWLLA